MQWLINQIPLIPFWENCRRYSDVRNLTWGIKWLAGSFRTEHAQFHELHWGVGLEQQVNSAHKCCITLAMANSIESIFQSQQTRGTRGVNGCAGTWMCVVHQTQQLMVDHIKDSRTKWFKESISTGFLILTWLYESGYTSERHGCVMSHLFKSPYTTHDTIQEWRYSHSKQRFGQPNSVLQGDLELSQ